MTGACFFVFNQHIPKWKKARVMTTIFNDESVVALQNLRKIAAALSQAATGSAPAGLKCDDANFTLSRSLPDVTSAVRDVGERLVVLIGKFEAAVEEQLVTFYRTMKQQVDQEHLLLRSTKSLMPSDPALLKHLTAATHEQLQQAAAATMVMSASTPKNAAGIYNAAGGTVVASTPNLKPSLPLISSPSVLRPAAGRISPPAAELLPLAVPSTYNASSHHRSHTSTVPKEPAVLASESLRMWLFITLQSTLQLCEASRGAIYLQATEGTAYLRRVCGINVEDRLPLDVSPAAGSTIATVVQNNVAVNIGRSRHRNPHALDAYSSASQAVRASVAIKINSGIIIPIGDVGCVVVADKTSESYFSELDEHVTWCTATLVRGVMRRYKSELLVGKTPSALVQALHASALLPPIAADHSPYDDGRSSHDSPQRENGVEDGKGMRVHQRAQESHHQKLAHANAVDYISPEEALQSLLPGITRIPRLPKKLVVVRTTEMSGFQQLLAKDVENLKKIELSDEDLLEAAVPYIANLEALWKKSIDSMTELRSTCERLDREIANRNSRIVELEVEHRILTRQLHAMKTDVQKIRSVVPTHLKELATADGPPSSPSMINAVASGEVRQLRRLPSTKNPQPPPKRSTGSRDPSTAR
jgi:hypothetical protein